MPVIFDSPDRILQLTRINVPSSLIARLSIPQIPARPLTSPFEATISRSRFFSFSSLSPRVRNKRACSRGAGKARLFWEINSAQTALIPRPTRQSLRNHLRNEGITETGFRPAFLRTTNARDENGNVRFNDRAFVHNDGTCRDERISYVLGAPFELLNVIWFCVRAVVIYTRICVAKCYNGEM